MWQRYNATLSGWLPHDCYFTAPSLVAAIERARDWANGYDWAASADSVTVNVWSETGDETAAFMLYAVAVEKGETR